MPIELKNTLIENRASTVEQRGNGIVFILIKPDLDFEIADVDDINEAILQLGVTENLKLLVDVRENTFGSKEVKEYGAKHGAADKYAKATAYITNSLGQKIIVNFFIKYFSHKKPLKLFTKESEALKWLNSI